jgi:hypothetical protein
MNDWYCPKKKKPIARPPIGTTCVIVEDGFSIVVNVVAYSSFDDGAFFLDSKNWKGVVSIHEIFYRIVPFDPLIHSENVVSIGVENKRLAEKKQGFIDKLISKLT